MTELLTCREQAAFALRGLYRSRGYRPYRMSRFEQYELYARNKDFLGSDRIITFSDADGRLLAMKPDVTLSVLRNAPEEKGVVRKVYYHENVYRDFREISQTGLECVGDLSAYEIAEVTVLAARSMAALGKPFVLEISHVGLVAAVLSGLDGERRALALQSLRRKNRHELQLLPPDCREKLLALLECRGDLPALEQALDAPAELEALEQLKQLLQALGQAGFAGQVRLDFSVSSDLKYYSGVVFRGCLQGVPRAVLSGGQYDLLARRLGRSSRAIGFAIYLDLLDEPQAEPAVDTLILHDGTVPTDTLLEAARQAEEQGSVLVAQAMPRDRVCRRVVDLRR